LLSPVYSIFSVDLRCSQQVFHDLVTRSISIDGSTSQPVLDVNLPTLVLAECVLVYMTPEHSDEVIKWFANTFAETSFIVYEMYGLTDNFGKVMKENLRVSFHVHSYL
jgi:[phosphatase 2A protein]-leucine-carboxy methyltransferase